MNQTFSINRFGRYMKFCLLRSRLVIWGSTTALAAGAFSILHNVKFATFALFIVMIVAVIPAAIFTMRKSGNTVPSDGSREMMLHPVSTVEKFVAQMLIIFAVPAIAFAIHAVAYGLGLNGVSSIVADGFDAGTMSVILLIVSLAALVSNFQYKWNGMVTNFSILFYGFGGVPMSLAEETQQYPPQTAVIIFAVALVVLCLHFFFFKHRTAKY